MSPAVNLVADLLLAVLLAATIGSSVVMSRRIARLKADEAAMRRTVAELVLASETAERAIAGLRTTLGECDRTLAERLRTAERYAADLADQVAAGEGLLQRIAQIVESSRRLSGEPKAEETEAPRETVVAPHEAQLSAAALRAQALAERAARRLKERAA